uniref:Uncharacterized protein n=1 Tax=Aeromonas caviae TaxID=648 RepID=A0A6M4NQC1_AERCA|nr:Hypothetical protein [Aeromonas caviae]QMV81595.1 Hypothetical protein [Aeromonas caviae]
MNALCSPGAGAVAGSIGHLTTPPTALNTTGLPRAGVKELVSMMINLSPLSTE